MYEIYAFACFLAVHLAGAQSPRVDCRAGAFTGQTDKITLFASSEDSGTQYAVDSFLGVPFAEPPVGDLRFKPPVPKAKSEKSFNAVKKAPACQHEKDTYFPGFEGAEMWNANDDAISEDCLYLNLWRPSGATPGSNLTVLVWIYGGGFTSGSPSLEIYRGDILAAYGQVIVVNINYRLNAFGFLYMGNAEAPGNVGLLDQQLSLNWIQQNIADFGGDPNSVTLFGESAGAASVSGHLLSVGSQALFNRAILQSGAMTNPWASISHERALNHSKQLASALGCEKNVAACLRGIPAAQLSAAASASITGLGYLEFPFVPVTKDEKFFKVDVAEAILSGKFTKKSILAGIVKDEGSFWSFYYLPQFYNKDNDSLLSIDEFEQSLKSAFASYADIDRQAIAYRYTRDCSSEPGFYRDAFDAAVSDEYFACDSLEFARTMQQHGSQVYLYRFDERISTNPWPSYSGVMHGYEIEFVFGLPLLYPDKYGREQLDFTKRIVDIWLSYAKTGIPDKKWPYLSETSDEAVLLKDITEFGREVQLKSAECRFWKQLHDRPKCS